MGTTLSASAIADGAKPPSDGNVKHADYHKAHPNVSGNPPPECPMHNKIQEPVVSECPISGGQGDINPLNMVRIFFFFFFA